MSTRNEGIAGNNGDSENMNSNDMYSSNRGNKTPPILSKSKSYDDWVKKINIWNRITCLSQDSRGGAILMTPEGEAEDAILELSEDELICADGVKNIIAKLDTIFKKNNFRKI